MDAVARCSTGAFNSLSSFVMLAFSVSTARDHDE